MLPPASVVVVNVARPVVVLTTPWPIEVLSSSKTTVPEASVPLLVTVAVNVMLVPKSVVAPVLSVRLVVVTARVTTCVRLFDVLAEKLMSPP